MIKEIEGFDYSTPSNILVFKLQQALEVIRELQGEVQRLLIENDTAGFINMNNLQKTIALTAEITELKKQLDRVRDTEKLAREIELEATPCDDKCACYFNCDEVAQKDMDKAIQNYILGETR